MVLRRRLPLNAFRIFLTLLAGVSFVCLPSMTMAATGVNYCGPGFAEKAAPADGGCCCCAKEKGGATCSGLQPACAHGESSTSLVSAPGMGSMLLPPAVISVHHPLKPADRDRAAGLTPTRETTYLINLNLLC